MRARIVWKISISSILQCTVNTGLAIQAASFRTFSNAPPLAAGETVARKDGAGDGPSAGQEKGAMSRRLAEMTEESVDTAGSSAMRNVESAGFSEELKNQLEARIAGDAFRSHNQRAFAEAEMPVRDLVCLFLPTYDFSQQAVVRRQGYSRSSRSSTLDWFRINP